jgi:hypothetical protein
VDLNTKLRKNKLRGIKWGFHCIQAFPINVRLKQKENVGGFIVTCNVEVNCLKKNVLALSSTAQSS